MPPLPYFWPSGRVAQARQASSMSFGSSFVIFEHQSTVQSFTDSTREDHTGRTVCTLPSASVT